jgi:hypothetical protein
MSGEAGQPGRIAVFRESDLKICELCGHLNLDRNPECFVCGWHGRFEHSPEVIRAAVELAVRRYGRLELHYLTDPRTYRDAAPSPRRSRFVAWLLRVWHWLAG